MAVDDYDDEQVSEKTEKKPKIKKRRHGYAGESESDSLRTESGVSVTSAPENEEDYGAETKKGQARK